MVMSHIRDISPCMSYIPDMTHRDTPLKLTRQLGQALRAERKRRGWTQAQTAQRAGIGRQKLIEVEQGRPSVVIGTYAAVMSALDLEPAVKTATISIDEFPQLKRLAWNRPGVRSITEQEALSLYERHWSLVDADQMDAHERALLQRLVTRHGNGVLHV